MSIKVQDLPLVSDYYRIDKSDTLLFSQEEDDGILTKNLTISAFDGHISSEMSAQTQFIHERINYCYDTLSTHTHVLSGITDLSDLSDTYTLIGHSHLLSDTTDLSDLSDTYTLIGHSHLLSDTTDLSDLSDTYTLIGHNHLLSDITNLSGLSDTYTLIGHKHDLSDINDLVNQIEHQLSGVVNATMYDAGDCYQTVLSNKIITILKPTNYYLEIKFFETCPRVQRHTYLYINNTDIDSVILQFQNETSFVSDREDALGTVKKGNKTLLEFTEVGQNKFFVNRYDTSDIQPVTIITFIVTYPIYVDYNGNQFADKQSTQVEVDNEYVWTFGAIDQELNSYRFLCWKYNDVEYNVGDTVVITQDADMYAVYVKDKTITFYDTDRITVLRKYTIRLNGKQIILDYDTTGKSTVECTKVEFPQNKLGLATYSWSMAIPTDFTAMEDTVSIYLQKDDISEIITQQEIEDTESTFSKNDEEVTSDNVVLLQIDADGTVYNDFNTGDKYLTII